MRQHHFGCKPSANGNHVLELLLDFHWRQSFGRQTTLKCKGCCCFVDSESKATEQYTQGKRPGQDKERHSLHYYTSCSQKKGEEKEGKRDCTLLCNATSSLFCVCSVFVREKIRGSDSLCRGCLIREGKAEKTSWYKLLKDFSLHCKSM